MAHLHAHDCCCRGTYLKYKKKQQQIQRSIYVYIRWTQRKYKCWRLWGLARHQLPSLALPFAIEKSLQQEQMVLFLSKLGKRTPIHPTHFCLRFSCASAAIRFWHVMYVVQTQTGENLLARNVSGSAQPHRLYTYLKSTEEKKNRRRQNFKRKDERKNKKKKKRNYKIKRRDFPVSLLYGHEGDSDWYFPRIAWRKRFGRIYMCVCLCLYVLYYTWLLHISILYTYRRAAFVSVFVWFSPEFGQFAPLGIRALSFAVWFVTWRNFLLLLLAASRQRYLIGLVVFLFWELLGEIIL